MKQISSSSKKMVLSEGKVNSSRRGKASSSSTDEDESFLAMGDHISLFSMDGCGYLSSEGFIDNNCFLQSQAIADAPLPSNFTTESIFCIVPKYKYDAQIAMNDYIERWSVKMDNLVNVGAEEEIRLLKANEEAEISENRKEYKRMAGKHITYGQIVQLCHVNSGKFLTITVKEIPELEKHYMKVVLDATGNEGSWFMVTPRFKMRSEGDTILNGDQIVLLSPKFHLSLHSSMKKFEDGNREVNASSDNIGISWRALLFAPYPKSQLYLRIGDVVRLFHKESEGYLTNERDGDKRSEEIFLDLKDSSKPQISNSNSLWLIERVPSNQGGIIRYSEEVRFRHLATGFYLGAFEVRGKIQANDNTGFFSHRAMNARGIVTSLFTTIENRDSENTIFTINSLRKNVDYSRVNRKNHKIPRDAYVCLHNKATNTWIHIERVSHAYAISEINLQPQQTATNSRLPVQGKSVLNDEDAFTLLPANREEINTLNYTKSQITVFKKYIQSLQKGNRSAFTQSSLDMEFSNQATVAKRVIKALEEMIISCTISSNMDPFTREGIPIRSRQNLLSEQKVTEVLMMLLRQNFIVCSIEDILLPENYTTYTICRLSYRLLKQIIKGNRNNQKKLSSPDEIRFMEDQIFFPEAIATLMELFKDNVNLLDRISAGQISFFVTLLRESGANSNFIQFLSILCVCDGDALPKNQGLVCEKLVVQNPDLLIPIKKERDLVYVKNVVGSGNWMEIETFVNTSTPKLLSYFIDTLKLFSNLCRGRNETTCEVISTVMTYDLLFTAIKNNNLPAQLREALCELLLCLYIDINPNEPQQFISYTRVWSDLDKRTIGKKHRDGMEAETSGRFNSLKYFILGYIEKHCSLVVEDVRQNSLTLAILSMLHHLVQYGYLHNFEIEELFLPLISMLDPSNDSISVGANEEQNAAMFAKNDNTVIVMQTKNIICEILNLFCDVRLDFRLTDLLHIFKSKFDMLGISEIPEIANRQRIINSDIVRRIDHLLSSFNLNQNGTFVPILTNLVKYDFPILAINSSRLLVRHFTQREELHKALQAVQILISQKNVQTYQMVQKQLELLRSWRSNAEISLDEITEIISQLTQLCISDTDENGERKVNTAHQRILLKLNAHEIVIDILPTKTRRNLFELTKTSFSFLRVFCRDNPANQMALFKHLNLFLRFLGRKVDEAFTINEIIKDNSQICSQITENQVRMVVNSIADGAKDPQFIEILENLCIVNGKPIRRNQNIVLKLMIEKQQDTLLLFNSKAAIQKRNSLILQNDHTNPHGLLCYHMKIVDLISKCARGKIYEAEIKCQSLYTLNDLYTHFSDPENLYEIKSHFVAFMLEVYFDTERVLRGFENDPSILKILKVFLSELVSLHNNYKAASEKERLIYIFDNIIPFLSTFYDEFLSIDKKFSVPFTKLTNKLQDAVAKLFYNEHFAEDRYRLITGKFLRIATSKGFWGKEFDRAYLEKSVAVFNEINENFELSASKDLAKRVASKEDKVLKGLIFFCKEFKETFHFNVELKAFTRVLKKNHNFTKKLVFLIRELRDVPDELILVSLQALRNLLSNPLKNSQSEDPKKKKQGSKKLNKYQNQLNDIGVTELIVSLISKGSDVVVHEALRLGISLLHDGNSNVQSTIYTHFSTNKSELFFSQIRSRIRKSILEIKEKQQFYLRKFEKIAAEYHDNNLDPPPDNQIWKKIAKDKDDEFEELGYIREILRFLQLLCEGHNLELQNYLRSQTQNVKSYDLISETASYLEALYREIDFTNIKIAIQLFITLTEYCQGPCGDNQFALIRTKLCESANHVLQRDYPPPCKFSQIQTLKQATIVTLLSLLEGVTSPSIPRQMIQTLNFTVMRENMDQFFENKDQTQIDIDSEEMELAFLYYHLISTLMDYETDGKLKNLLEQCTGHDIFEKETGRIEIVRNGRLERVYFKKPSVCKKLTQESKDNLLWTIKRDNQQDKIEDFFERSEHLMQEMTHREHLMKDKKFSILSDNETKIKDTSFVLSILINFLIIWWFSSNAQVPIYDYVIIILLGICHITCSALSLFIFLQFNAGLILRQRWKRTVTKGSKPKDDEKEDENGGIKPQNYESIPKDWKFYLLSTFYLLTDFLLVFRLMYLIFSILGVVFIGFSGPFFFSFHLLDVIHRSELLKYVIKSVTQNGRSIILTVVLATVIVYIYSILGYLFFADKFVIDDSQSCESIFQCLVTVLNYGVRSGGGIGDILEPPVWSSPGTLLRVLYDSSFFFVVIVLLLNIIFGIIIDTFGELRALNKATEFDIKNKCFVCGIERYTFDRHAEGFETHIERDHNMWHYLYFVMYLKLKLATEYTGPEQYVADALASKDLSFIPNLQAICLHMKDEEEEKKSKIMAKSILDLAATTKQGLQNLSVALEDSQSKLLSQIEAVKQNANVKSTELNTKVSERIEKLEKNVANFSAKFDRIATLVKEIKEVGVKRKKQKRKASFSSASDESSSEVDSSEEEEDEEEGEEEEDDHRHPRHQHERRKVIENEESDDGDSSYQSSGNDIIDTTPANQKALMINDKVVKRAKTTPTSALDNNKIIFSDDENEEIRDKKLSKPVKNKDEFIPNVPSITFSGVVAANTPQKKVSQIEAIVKTMKHQNAQNDARKGLLLSPETIQRKKDFNTKFPLPRQPQEKRQSLEIPVLTFSGPHSSSDDFVEKEQKESHPSKLKPTVVVDDEKLPPIKSKPLPEKMPIKKPNDNQQPKIVFSSDDDENDDDDKANDKPAFVFSDDDDDNEDRDVKTKDVKKQPAIVFSSDDDDNDKKKKQNTKNNNIVTKKNIPVRVISTGYPIPDTDDVPVIVKPKQPPPKITHPTPKPSSNNNQKPPPAAKPKITFSSDEDTTPQITRNVPQIKVNNDQLNKNNNKPPKIVFSSDDDDDDKKKTSQEKQPSKHDNKRPKITFSSDHDEDDKPPVIVFSSDDDDDKKKKSDKVKQPSKHDNINKQPKIIFSSDDEDNNDKPKSPPRKKIENDNDKPKVVKPKIELKFSSSEDDDDKPKFNFSSSSEDDNINPFDRLTKKDDKDPPAIVFSSDDDNKDDKKSNDKPAFVFSDDDDDDNEDRDVKSKDVKKQPAIVFSSDDGDNDDKKKQNTKNNNIVTKKNIPVRVISTGYLIPDVGDRKAAPQNTKPAIVFSSDDENEENLKSKQPPATKPAIVFSSDDDEGDAAVKKSNDKPPAIVFSSDDDNNKEKNEAKQIKHDGDNKPKIVFSSDDEEGNVDRDKKSAPKIVFSSDDDDDSPFLPQTTNTKQQPAIVFSSDDEDSDAAVKKLNVNKPPAIVFSSDDDVKKKKAEKVKQPKIIFSSDDDENDDNNKANDKPAFVFSDDDDNEDRDVKTKDIKKQPAIVFSSDDDGEDNDDKKNQNIVTKKNIPVRIISTGYLIPDVDNSAVVVNKPAIVFSSDDDDDDEGDVAIKKSNDKPPAIVFSSDDDGDKNKAATNTSSSPDDSKPTIIFSSDDDDNDNKIGDGNDNKPAIVFSSDDDDDKNKTSSSKTSQPQPPSSSSSSSSSSNHKTENVNNNNNPKIVFSDDDNDDDKKDDTTPAIIFTSDEEDDDETKKKKKAAASKPPIIFSDDEIDLTPATKKLSKTSDGSRSKKPHPSSSSTADQTSKNSNAKRSSRPPSITLLPKFSSESSVLRVSPSLQKNSKKSEEEEEDALAISSDEGSDDQHQIKKKVETVFGADDEIVFSDEEREIAREKIISAEEQRDLARIQQKREREKQMKFALLEQKKKRELEEGRDVSPSSPVRSISPMKNETPPVEVKPHAVKENSKMVANNEKRKGIYIDNNNNRNSNAPSLSKDKMKLLNDPKSRLSLPADKIKRKSKRRSKREDAAARKSKLQEKYTSSPVMNDKILSVDDDLPDASIVFSSDEEEKAARAKKKVDNTGYTSPTSKRKIEKIEKDPLLSKYFTKK